jgi:hypothetical protein
MWTTLILWLFVSLASSSCCAKEYVPKTKAAATKPFADAGFMGEQCTSKSVRVRREW